MVVVCNRSSAQVFPSLDVMGESHLSASPNGLVGNNHQRGVLGDYRIVQEIGRGGMGVVYEAEQISLDRRVALKVLPFASVLDERQVRRFRNEARAVAQLKHANIVQVFGVGCERSVHFYAMEYVEGEPLSTVIADLRRLEGIDDDPVPEGSLAGSLASGQFDAAPSSGRISECDVDGTPSSKASLSMETSTRSNKYFHSVARLSLQIAEALEHAHQEGVIHRDIKPSNLMIDAHGKALVTDFGLARIETDAAMTMTGDLVGTMRYMSPEQALAKRVVIDQRTDT